MNWSKKDVINICKIVAFGIILYWALQNIATIGNAFKSLTAVLSPFIWGAAIAFVVNIPMTILENNVFTNKKSKKNNKRKSKLVRFISIIISMALLICLIVGIIFAVIPELINVIDNILQIHLPNFIVGIRDVTNKAINDYPDISNTLRSIQYSLESINSELIRNITAFGTNIVTLSIGVVSTAIKGVFKLIVAIIFAIYILMSKEKIIIHLTRVLYAYLDKNKADKVCKIAKLSNQSFYNFVTGQFFESIILGSLCAIGMAILKMPYGATVGVLVAITAYIPIIGALIGGAVGAILLLSISFKKALVFVIFFTILQQTENNVIYPKVVGSRVGVPGILVLIAVALGGKIAGAIGMVVCLPITAILYTLLMEGTNRRLREKRLEGNNIKNEKE